MKKYISILSVALAATLLASCNKEVSDDSIAYYIDKSEITAVVPQPVMAGMSADKAVIYEDGVVKFEWIKNIDAISVNAGVDGETMLYTVKSVDEAPTHCVFKVENFLLNAVADYYAVYPMTASTTTVVPFDMAGQCQKAFDDNSHLSEYSYMTAGPVKSNRYGGLDFPFQYKVSWVVFNIMSPKTFTAKEITLSSDTECFAAEGTIDVADNGKVSASLTNEVKLLLGEDGIEVKGGEEYHAVMAVMGVDAPDGIYVEVAGVDKEGEPYTPLSYANPDFDTELVAGSYYTIDIVTDAVVKVGDNCYDNLVDAVAAAQNGDIVKMLADFQTTDQVTVGADKNIVLDLNGKTISYTTDGYGAFITNKGTLTVNDSSEGKNGKITAKHNKPDYMNGCYTIDNAGVSSGTSTLVIEAGTIENTSGAGLAWPVNNGSWGTSADLVINGGTIHSVNYVPVREYLHYTGKKTIVINGGKFISDNSRAIAVQCNDAVIKETEASVTINGGEFSCNGSGILYVDLHAANLDMTGFTMTVNGGKFKNANADAPVLVYDDEGNPQTTAKLLSKIIKGGIYSKEPAAEILADNYEVVDNDDEDTKSVYPYKVAIENKWSNFIAEKFSDIDDSAKTLYISTPGELALFAQNVNNNVSYAGYTITISGSLDMGQHSWTPINAYNGCLSGATIQGTDNAVISNLKVENAVNGKYYAGFIAQTVGQFTIKDITFSNCAVSVDGGSGIAVVLGDSYSNVLFDNVKVKSSTVAAETKAGALLGFSGGDGVTVTVRDCSVENVAVKAEYSYAIMVGLVNTNDQVKFEGTNSATDSHAVLDEVTAAKDFPQTKEIKGYTFGVDGTTLWVMGMKDAWAECRTNPSPKMTISDVEYTIKGDKFYHAGGVVVDITE